MTTPNRPPSCDLPPEFYQQKLKPCPSCSAKGNMPGGFIKKRVRVCEVAAAGEKPALATK